MRRLFARPWAHFPLSVFQIAVGDQPLNIIARRREHGRIKASPKQLPVVASRIATLRCHDLCHPVAKSESAPQFRAPFGVMGDNVCLAHFTRQNRRQHDVFGDAARFSGAKNDIDVRAVFKQILRLAAPRSPPPQSSTGALFDHFTLRTELRVGRDCKKIRIVNLGSLIGHQHHFFGLSWVGVI
ncbi:MAG: hypothetical protein AB8B51_01345 [Sedimentitalea sp.]